MNLPNHTLSNSLLNPLAEISASTAKTLSDISAGLTRFTAYIRTKNELLSLTDRELIDIGINRYDIETVAREHSWNLPR